MCSKKQLEAFWLFFELKTSLPLVANQVQSVPFVLPPLLLESTVFVGLLASSAFDPFCFFQTLGKKKESPRTNESCGGVSERPFNRRKKIYEHRAQSAHTHSLNGCAQKIPHKKGWGGKRGQKESEGRGERDAKHSSYNFHKGYYCLFFIFSLPLLDQSCLILSFFLFLCLVVVRGCVSFP